MGRNREGGSVRLRIEPCGEAVSPNSISNDDKRITEMNQFPPNDS